MVSTLPYSDMNGFDVNGSGVIGSDVIGSDVIGSDVIGSDVICVVRLSVHEIGSTPGGDVSLRIVPSTVTPDGPRSALALRRGSGSVASRMEPTPSSDREGLATGLRSPLPQPRTADRDGSADVDRWRSSWHGEPATRSFAFTVSVGRQYSDPPS